MNIVLLDQIGQIDNTEGCNVFLNGGESQAVSIEGLPADASLSISLDPFRMNILSFLPQECMSTEDVFSGYEESLLVVKGDNSDFYVPAFNVMTLTQMCPGEGYGVFLNGTNGLDFTYPMGGGVARNASHASIEEYKLIIPA